ncbi:MAG: protein kinase, partial [Polyangiaceae bacterium]
MTGSAPALTRRIGRFELGRRIGAGGMAAVFAAREHGPMDLGRLVALKVMSAALVGDPDSERMFLREAGLSARLEHRHIVRVYEVGEADGTLFISMELLHGATLNKLCARESPPLPIALRLLADISKALHFAHELRDARGGPLDLVHQDVTPHNVMVTYDGVPKLLDFGVARIGAMDASRTDTIRGKPAYLAPEQVLGERLDRRTDVFALGAIAYELLTGSRLFKGGSQLEIYAAISSKAIPQASDHDIPGPIAAVVDQATDRNPKKRFDDMAAMGEALEEARLAVGVTDVEEGVLGAWAREHAPPTYSLLELEREITEGQTTTDDTTTDVADLLTERTGRPSGSDPSALTDAPTKSEVRQKPTTISSSIPYLLVVLATVVLGVLGSPWISRSTSTTATPHASATAAHAATTSVAPPPTAEPKIARSAQPLAPKLTVPNGPASTSARRPPPIAKTSTAPNPPTSAAPPSVTATTLPVSTEAKSSPTVDKAGKIAVRSSP